MGFVSKVMEVVVLPLFILTIGVEIADLASLGVTEILSFVNWNFMQSNNMVLYFVLLAMISFILSHGLNKVLQLANNTEKKLS